MANIDLIKSNLKNKLDTGSIENVKLLNSLSLAELKTETGKDIKYFSLDSEATISDPRAYYIAIILNKGRFFAYHISATIYDNEFSVDVMNETVPDSDIHGYTSIQDAKNAIGIKESKTIDKNMSTKLIRIPANIPLSVITEAISQLNEASELMKADSTDQLKAIAEKLGLKVRHVGHSSIDVSIDDEHVIEIKQVHMDMGRMSFRQGPISSLTLSFFDPINHKNVRKSVSVDAKGQVDINKIKTKIAELTAESQNAHKARADRTTRYEAQKAKGMELRQQIKDLGLNGSLSVETDGEITLKLNEADILKLIALKK